VDLIQKPKPDSGGRNLAGSINLIKSRGISISGKRLDLSLLKSKWAVISIACVFFALLCFGAIRGYIFYLDKKTSDLKQRADALISGQDANLISDAGSIEALGNTVNKLNRDHIFSSNFFVMLEKITLPEIKWSGLALDAVLGTANLGGKAASYSYLAKQIIDFEKEKMRIAVSGISLDKDGVSFSAILKFDPALLKLEAK